MVLVNRDFQLRYAGAAVFVGIISTLLSSVLILYPLYEFEILRIPNFLPMPILFGMGIAALLNICLVGIMGILVTHRMAGPMYSMVRQLRVIEEGKWSGRMRLRHGDDMKYLVRNFNAMIEALERTGQTDLQNLRRLKKEINNETREPEKRIKAAGELIEQLEDTYLDRLGGGESRDNAS